MKKTLLLLIAAALISGCVTATESSLKNEGVLPSFAYVIGKSPAQTFYFQRSGESQYSYSHDKTFNLAPGEYTLRKIQPGVYYATSASTHRSTLSNNGMPLFTVNLEAGKITYVGDISIGVSGAATPPPPGMPDLYAGVQQRVTTNKEVKNDSEAAKKFVKERIPELAENLDSIFVYRPAQ